MGRPSLPLNCAAGVLVKIVIVSQDSQQRECIRACCEQALPLAECVQLGSTAESEMPLILGQAGLILCADDTQLLKVLALAPARAVIALGEDESAEARVRSIRLGAAEYLALGELAPALLSRIAHFVLEVRLLSERNGSMASRVDYLSSHDSLTGARNRSQFFADLADQSELAMVDDEHLAVLLIKLDAFRAVNDTLGQQAGDTVLKIMAQRLRNVLRDDDAFYRTDGNQFAVLVRHAGDEAGVRRAGMRFLEALGRPLNVYTQNIECAVSIGASRWPEDAETIDALVTAADAALRAARSEGGGLRLADASMIPPKLSQQPDSSLIRH